MKRFVIASASLIVVVMLAGAAFGTGATRTDAADAGPYTCTGGSIPAGTYSSLKITGVCALDSGNVMVHRDVNVKKGGALIAAFGGSDLTVGRDLQVERNGTLVLGCEPQALPCLNDPDQVVGTLSAHDSIGGSLTADEALAVLVHNNAIGRDINVEGGGGGVNCAPQAVLHGGPAYATFEDITIGHNASITNFQSCWLGFFRNTVSGSVRYDRNVTAIPDGNEVATNTIDGKLSCFGNSPAPQIGDSGGALNVVEHGGKGQCASLVAP